MNKLTPEQEARIRLDKQKHPEKYCRICGTKIGICNHTGIQRKSYRIAKPFFEEKQENQINLLKNKLLDSFSVYDTIIIGSLIDEIVLEGKK